MTTQEAPECREFGGFDLNAHLEHWLCEDHNWHPYSAETFLYLIAERRFVKIGVSDDPTGRLRQIQTCNPRPVKLLAAYLCPTGIEVALHDYFHAERVTGEWFRRSPRIERLIADIRMLGEEWEREQWQAERLSNPISRAALKVLTGEATPQSLNAWRCDTGDAA